MQWSLNPLYTTFDFRKEQYEKVFINPNGDLDIILK
jgi:hypothetical protein